MTLPETVIHCKRKYDADGLEELLVEAGTTILESEPVTTLARRVVGDWNVVGREQLRTAGRDSWRTFDDAYEAGDGSERVRIPPKMRLPVPESFTDLEPTEPTTPFVTEFESATVLGPYGLGIAPDGRAIADTIAPPSLTDRRLEVVFSRSLAANGYRSTRAVLDRNAGSPSSAFDVATPLVPVWSNYYHWTIECLPRVAGVEAYARRTGRQPTILLPPDPSSWLLESLDLLGVDDDRWEPIPDGEITVDRLVVPSYPTPSRSECRWLADRMRRAVDAAAADDRSARIYITRRNATKRRVVNDEAVFAVLDEFDVEPYALESLSVAEQVALFSSAELIVSPHGAGLTNAIYGTEPAIVELFGRKQKTTFYRLAKLLGFEYHVMFCEDDGSDLVVDPDALRSTVAGVLSGDATPVLPARTDRDAA